jgi:ABC-type transport system substrate-binding protein
VELLSLVRAEKNKLRDAGDFHTIDASVFCMAGDPDEVIGYFTSDSPTNIGGYVNPEVDRLLVLQSSETDPAKRKEYAQEVERLVLADMAVISEGFNTWPVVWWPHVKDYVPLHSTYGAHERLERVWLDK